MTKNELQAFLAGQKNARNSKGKAKAGTEKVASFWYRKNTPRSAWFPRMLERIFPSLRPEWMSVVVSPVFDGFRIEIDGKKILSISGLSGAERASKKLAKRKARARK